MDDDGNVIVDNTKLELYDSLIEQFILAIINKVNFDRKNTENLIDQKNFLFSIDHCFNIKNKGTIVTGTVLNGKISVGDTIFFPDLSCKKVVKEMQMFKRPISKVCQGDRVGMLIKNLDHTKAIILFNIRLRDPLLVTKAMFSQKKAVCL